MELNYTENEVYGSYQPVFYAAERVCCSVTGGTRKFWSHLRFESDVLCMHRTEHLSLSTSFVIYKRKFQIVHASIEGN